MLCFPSSFTGLGGSYYTPPWLNQINIGDSGMGKHWRRSVPITSVRTFPMLIFTKTCTPQLGSAYKDSYSITLDAMGPPFPFQYISVRSVREVVKGGSTIYCKGRGTPLGKGVPFLVHHTLMFNSVFVKCSSVVL